LFENYDLPAVESDGGEVHLVLALEGEFTGGDVKEGEGAERRARGKQSQLRFLLARTLTVQYPNPPVQLQRLKPERKIL
jgi:hypothetical protein